MAAKSDVKAVEILAPQYGELDLCILGTTPFICNRQSEKVKRELIMPAVKSRASRAQNMKHNPLIEYRNSPYTMPSSSETLLALLAVAFKRSMCTAALDTPGANKTQTGRLVHVEGERLHLWGVPKLSMMVTRDASINRTPDVRTRAIVPEWATRLRVAFPSSIIKAPSIVNLLSAGGRFAGVGDGRPEKGWGNYGTFEVVNDDDERWLSVVAAGGYDAQAAAMESPQCYDDETESLLEWWRQEAEARGFEVAA